MPVLDNLCFYCESYYYFFFFFEDRDVGILYLSTKFEPDPFTKNRDLYYRTENTRHTHNKKFANRLKVDPWSSFPWYINWYIPLKKGNKLSIFRIFEELGYFPLLNLSRASFILACVFIVKAIIINFSKDRDVGILYLSTKFELREQS